MDPRNPYIEEFLRALIKRKGEKLEPDVLERLVESLNRLLENMVGRNMIAALPEDVRRAFVLSTIKEAGMSIRLNSHLFSTSISMTRPRSWRTRWENLPVSIVRTGKALVGL